jgi:molecular chaperone DnaJ
MARMEDLYIVLEIGRKASVNEIKRAFRRLARRFHPDINPGDRHAEERFKRITEAYDILSDPLKRQFYDVNGFYTEGVLEEPGGRTSHWGFSFQGFDFSRSRDADFDEIFGDMWNRRNSRGPERGQDIETPLALSFNDSIRGVKGNVNFSRMRACEICNGAGQAPGSHEMACVRCGGTGKTPRVKGHLQFAVTCADCGGTGRAITLCPGCHGEGRVSANENLAIDVPAGAMTGTRIRVPGRGDAGRFGGPAGDLYIVVSAGSHPFFERKGDNIHCTVPLTLTEAALGAKIQVPTIEGPAIIRIPPGTQSGQKLRIREKGAPSLLNPGVRGDQYVEVKVVVPKVADERSKEILRELAKLNPEDPRRDLW